MAKQASGSTIRVVADVVFTIFSIGFFVFIVFKLYIHFRNRKRYPDDDPPTNLIKSQPELDRRMINRNISNNFKLKYCETLKKPMMIGLENGKTKHFEWEDGQNAFVSDCNTCRFDEECPPSYTSMFG